MFFFWGKHNPPKLLSSFQLVYLVLQLVARLSSLCCPSSDCCEFLQLFSYFLQSFFFFFVWFWCYDVVLTGLKHEITLKFRPKAIWHCSQNQKQNKTPLENILIIPKNMAKFLKNHIGVPRKCVFFSWYKRLIL